MISCSDATINVAGKARKYVCMYADMFLTLGLLVVLDTRTKSADSDVDSSCIYPYSVNILQIP